MSSTPEQPGAPVSPITVPQSSPPSAAAPAPPSTPPAALIQPGSTVEGGTLPAPAPPGPSVLGGTSSTPTIGGAATNPLPFPSRGVRTTTPAAPVAARNPRDELITRLIASRSITETGDVTRPRDDNDVVTGQFARVASGPYQGRYVNLVRTLDQGDDGYPTAVLVRTRDDRDEDLILDYKILRPAPRGQR